MSDIKPYNEMQSNPKVMQYVTGEVQTEKEHLIELNRLIGFYNKEGNDFWIYAIDRKLDNQFIGTVGFCKDKEGDDEIGYRFLEKYWGLGYGSDLCKALHKSDPYPKPQYFSKNRYPISSSPSLSLQKPTVPINWLSNFLSIA